MRQVRKWFKLHFDPLISKPCIVVLQRCSNNRQQSGFYNQIWINPIGLRNGWVTQNGQHNSIDTGWKIKHSYLALCSIIQSQHAIVVAIFGLNSCRHGGTNLAQLMTTYWVSIPRIHIHLEAETNLFYMWNLLKIFVVHHISRHYLNMGKFGVLSRGLRTISIISGSKDQCWDLRFPNCCN